jgi:hypothetical protein
MNIAVHRLPAWQDKANFLIHADLANFGLAERKEQLWARQLALTRFEICCIPFFTYGIALGDVVETNVDSNEFATVNEKRGHKTFRIAIKKRQDSGECHVIVHDMLMKLEALYEWYDSHYVAVDVESAARQEQLVVETHSLQMEGQIFYELDD